MEKFDDLKTENFTMLITRYTNIWKKIFSLVNSVDMKNRLTPKILSDPENDLVKTLIYIYSMESFVYKEMNKTSREKDISRIKYYGPLAAALSFIIHCGNH